MDRVSVDRDAEQFILRRNEERCLKNLANGLLDNKSDDSDDESLEEENLAEVEDEEPSSRTRFEPGRSRSGRRVRSLDIVFKYTFCIVSHNFTIAIKWKNLK